MEVRYEIFLLILGACIVTLIPRILPLVVLSRFHLPDWAQRWLNHIPVAIMMALLAQEIFVPSFNSIKFLAALPAFAVAILTRSLLGTVVIGIVSMMVLRHLF
jgi:branched-subunit amino acid transport protein